jgi:CMP-N-acetylneuraminic acid synthetase
MKVIALLPMKAHSERIPNKNIRLFAGKPLYHHVASVLEKSDLIDSILINTDSAKIADEARKIYTKAKIIRRPSALQGDLVPMNKIICHDINTTSSEHFLQTHSTNPLLSIKTLEAAVTQYFESIPEFDSLFSVTKMQNRFYWESGQPINHDPKELLRTQDLSPLFEENSNIYLFSRTSFVSANNNRIGLRPKMFVMNKIESTDIDDEQDWKLAETLYRSQQEASVIQV